MATTPYIDHADLRQYLGQIQASDATDATLDAIGRRATARVNTALGFAFAGYTAGVQTVRSFGTERLLLPPYEAGSVSSVVWGSYTLPTTDYVEREGALLIKSYGPSGYASIVGLGGWGYALYDVTANWGYGDPPDDIVEVALELAVNIWRSKDKGGFTEVVGVEGSGAIRAVAGLTKDQQAVIDSYRALYRGAIAL